MFTKEQLTEMFGESWYEVLGEYLNSPNFTTIATKLAELRRTKEIYPKKGVFRCFKETPYSKVKLIMLSYDPYNNDETFADGLAFSNSMSKTISPSLKNILQEIDDEYPENKELITHGKLDPQDLLRWAKQGILLLNVALTVEKNKAGSHLEMWKSFTTFVLSKLNEKQDLVWLMLGKDAQRFESLITNPTHSIIEAAHPAVSCYGGSGFFDSNIFRECNNQLLARNKKEVVW